MFVQETPQIRARNLLWHGDLEAAARIADAEIQRVGNRGSTNDLWKFRFIRADVLQMHGHREEALKYLESLAPPDSWDVESCAALKMHCGYYSGLLGHYELSHRLLGQAEAMARSAEVPELQAGVHLNQAFIFFLQKDYVLSDCMFRSVLSFLDQSDGWYFRGSALWGIGKNLMIQGHYRDAMPWLESSLEIFEAAGARLDIAMVWSEQAVCHLGLGDDTQAMELFRKAEKVNYEAGFVHNYQVVLANIGNVYLHRRDHFRAIVYYRRALALAREINDPVSIKKWTYNLNLAYARIRESVDRSSCCVA
jgi:tetratricopeptide (TPR) repeat protein